MRNLGLSSPREVGSPRRDRQGSRARQAQRVRRLPRRKAGAPVFAPLVHPPPGRRSDLSRLPALRYRSQRHRAPCRKLRGDGRWNPCRPARSCQYAARSLDPPWVSDRMCRKRHIASLPGPGKPPRSGRPARSRQHAAWALDPPWVGWHVPEETPRRARPAEGRRGPVAGWVSRQHAARALGHARRRMAYRREACHVRPHPRRLNAIEVGSTTTCLVGTRAPALLAGWPDRLSWLEEVGCRGALPATWGGRSWVTQALARAVDGSGNGQDAANSSRSPAAWQNAAPPKRLQRLSINSNLPALQSVRRAVGQGRIALADRGEVGQAILAGDAG